ncbi:MAG: M14 family zinc carboxypeptidase [Bacteriovoracaceae bacterium]
MKKYLLSTLIILCSFPLLAATATPYETIVTRLKELAKQPNTSLFSLGKNDQDKEIVGIILGDASKAKTKHLLVGTHHGNERMAAEVPFHFANIVLKALNDPSSPDHDKYENILYYVVPVLNISGYNVNRREETGADNRNHDSNRDYEDPCATKADFGLKSTSLISELIEKEHIIAAVTVHGYVGTFTYPWGVNAEDYRTMDDALMVDLAKKAVVFNKYKAGTHGGAIYPTAGAFEDWAYYKHGVWSFLLEIKSASSDLKKDAQAVDAFFKMAPVERSHNIGQTVNCTDRILRYRDIGRP